MFSVSYSPNSEREVVNRPLHNRSSSVKEGGENRSAGVSKSNRARDVIVRAPDGWRGVLGAALPAESKLYLRLVGNQEGPVVTVLGGISANRFVADEGGNQTGWWSDIVGETKAIDLTQFCVAGFDFVAGDGETPLELTPADEAELLAYALSKAGIQHLHGLVGASFGGMVGLSFARQFPERLNKLAVICAAHCPSPIAQAWRTVQQQVLAFAIEQGEPEKGVALARSLAMTTYRTAAEFNQRFGCTTKADGGVRDYLEARGEAYKSQVTAARYLTLSSAIDRHFERPEDITTTSLIIGVDSDQIVPLSDLKDLAARLTGEASLIKVTSPFGHDAFLKEADLIAAPIAKFFS